MRSLLGWMLLAALLAGPASAQDTEGDGNPGADGCGETTIIVEDDDDDGSIEIVVDPFAEGPRARIEPNRPAAVKVGVWPPPVLDADQQGRLQRLTAARDEEPDDKGHRYRLGDFYLEHGWHPHAEAEFLAAAKLDPESIRPWEALLRVYRAGRRTGPDTIVFQGPGIVVRTFNSRNDWLPSDLDRDLLITRVYREILKRRPDDVERRGEFVRHLDAMGLFEEMVAEAREALRRLPGDADTRYLLAEGLRRFAADKKPETQGLGTPEWTEAVAQLEQLVKRRPDHIPGTLRLIRVLCHEHGDKAAARATAMEERAFFDLFTLGSIAPVPFGKDALRLAKSLCSSRTARDLWDRTMGAPDDLAWNPDRRFFDRWVFLAFPNNEASVRVAAIDRLARRGDAAVAGVLLALLWHDQDEPKQPAAFRPFLQPRPEPAAGAGAEVERAALRAAAGLGPACYAGAERFLVAADTPQRKRRGVQLLRLLGNPRAVVPLLTALPADTDEEYALGVAAALEAIGDARAIDALVAAALDLRRPSVRRRECIEALAVFRDPRAIEAVKRLEKETEFGLVTAYALFRLTGNGGALDRMRTALTEGGLVGECLRLADKCESPRVLPICLDALEKGGKDHWPAAVAILRKRFWAVAEDKVREFFLGQAGARAVDPFAMRMLGELGGEKVADRLLMLVEQADGQDWPLVARALAQTGDARAVRYFNRLRILERDEARRELASQLHEVAAKRQTELRKD